VLRDKEGKSTRHAAMMKGPFKSGLEDIVDMRKDKGMGISNSCYLVLSGTGTAEEYQTLIELTDGEAPFLRNSTQEMIKSPVKFQQSETGFCREITSPRSLYGTVKRGYGKVHCSCAARCKDGIIHG
jgi:hypothetical protein